MVSHSILNLLFPKFNIEPKKNPWRLTRNLQCFRGLFKSSKCWFLGVFLLMAKALWKYTNLKTLAPVALRRSVTVKSSKVGCCALMSRSWIMVPFGMRPRSITKNPTSDGSIPSGCHSHSSATGRLKPQSVANRCLRCFGWKMGVIPHLFMLITKYQERFLKKTCEP